MQNINKLKIDKYITECDKHQKRINSAYHKIANKLPLNAQSYQNLTEDDIEHIDQFLFRYAKLQDAIGQRLFKTLLNYLEEETEGLPFIDILNKLEKLNLIESVEQWQTLREIRNAISHEYDDNPQLMAHTLNTVFQSKDQLLRIYQNLTHEYQKRQLNEQVQIT
ncbi:MAG: hypothetical protein ACP5D0_07920 [Hydrogenovibrio sp.]